MHSDLRAALERVEGMLRCQDRAREIHHKWMAWDTDIETLCTALRRHLNAEAKPVAFSLLDKDGAVDSFTFVQETAEAWRRQGFNYVPLYTADPLRADEEEGPGEEDGPGAEGFAERSERLNCKYCGCKLAQVFGGLEEHRWDCPNFPL